MRPAGEIRMALLDAATALATPEQGSTLRELAAKACVGIEAARRTVENMTRHGALHKCGTRKVAYRNRPVAEYAPPRKRRDPDQDETVDVAGVFALWAQS